MVSDAIVRIHAVLEARRARHNNLMIRSDGASTSTAISSTHCEWVPTASRSIANYHRRCLIAMKRWSHAHGNGSGGSCRSSLS